NDKFLKENLKERIEKNTIGYSVEEVVKLWNDKESIQEKNQEKEISILVEDWQIEKETENFLYVTIDTALDKEATQRAGIFIVASLSKAVSIVT
ncbi:hypothetical protein PSZ91_23785, partial [Shigella sonnei]|nr:hypothetical protein [Shigella sonnei]